MQSAPDRTEFDVVVAGTGIGGAALGYTLARSGRSVLFLEQGQDLRLENAIRGVPAEASENFQASTPSDPSAILARAGRNWQLARDGIRRDDFLPFIGCGSGGSSTLYGMVLERFFPQDFDSWPIDYQELAPYYSEAETLFEVAGGADPLRPGIADALGTSKPLSTAISDHLTRRGLHPYRLHLACRLTAACQLCQGFLCPPGVRCRNDALNCCLSPALATGNARMLTNVRVTHLEASNRRIGRVHAVGPSGEKLEFRGKLVVLAAGALGTPRILLQSGNLANASGLVGRRLMRHSVDLFILTLAPRINHPRDSKDFGLNDFYFDGGDRLGTVQSFGQVPAQGYAPGGAGQPLARLLRPVMPVIATMIGRAPVVAAIAEDDPNPANRVELEGEGIRVTYQPSERDVRRRRTLRRHVGRAFAGLGGIRVRGRDDRAGLAHACGTVRFGDDPSQSVLDRFNRVHEMENLYVSDASFFPTSVGMNPGLTVAANALRIARHMSSIM